MDKWQDEKLTEILDRIEKIDNRSQSIDTFLMKPALPGKKTRAEELDDLLAAARAGKMGARIMLYCMGFVITLSGAWASLKGWWQ